MLTNRTCVLLLGLVSGQVICFVLVLLQVPTFISDDEEQNFLNLPDSNHIAIAYHESLPRINICPSTRHLFPDDPTFLETSHKELELFHNTGGNLKTIETYLNDNIDETLKLLGVKFTAYGADKPLPPHKSIREEMQRLLVEDDKEKRGGYTQRYGQGRFTPKLGVLRGSEKKWKNVRFDVTEPVQDFLRWKKALGPLPRLCKQLDTIKPSGKKKQSFEEKFMCSLGSLANNNSDSSTIVTSGGHKEQADDNKCDLISIGSNGEWGFEETIVATTICKTHTFDCTTQENPRKPNIDSIHYYPFCITNEYKKIDEREYLTYSQILEKAGLESPPTLLKMDVEGFEFDVLSQMLQDAEARNTKHLLPLQISIELHYITRMYDLPWHMRQRQAGEIAMFSSMMFNKGGYVITHAKFMEGCDSCAEVLFVRTFCD